MTLEQRTVLDPTTPRAGAPLRQPVPVLSYVILGGSVLMFVLEASGYVDGPGVLYGPAVAAGEWWRVLLTVFEHGGPLHLLLNMSVVWTLGRMLETRIQTWRFGLISLATALGSSTMALLFAFPRTTVGASGMILGWAGAMLPIVPASGRRELGTWLLQVALISVLPGISWQGHLGGFLVGLPCGFALKLGGQGRRFLALMLGVLAVVVAAAYLAGTGRFYTPPPPGTEP